MWMSLFGMSCSRRFWSLGSRIATVADIMSRNDFESIKNGLHFVDNTTRTNYSGPGFKFMKLIDHFNYVAGKIPMDEMCSVDEQILPAKTRKTKLRQYNPRKPKKWGFKIFMITGPKMICKPKKWGFKIFMITGPTGLVHKIEFYLVMGPDWIRTADRLIDSK